QRRLAGPATRSPDAGRLRQLPQPLGVDPGHAARTAIDMPMTRTPSGWIVVAGLVGAVPAHADDTAIARPAARARGAADDDLQLRLTLSALLFRETGADAPAIVDQGAPLPNASPVQRSFGDLRTELSVGGLAVDARIRQTTSERYQAGAAGGGEY